MEHCIPLFEKSPFCSLTIITTIKIISWWPINIYLLYYFSVYIPILQIIISTILSSIAVFCISVQTSQLLSSFMI